MWSWIQLNWVKMMGWWPYGIEDERQRILYKMRGYLFFCFLPLVTCLEATSLILAIQSGVLKSFLSIITMLAMSSSMSIKAFIWVFYPNKIKSIVEQFERLESRWKEDEESSSNEGSLAIMEYHTRVCLRILQFIVAFLSIFVLHWAVRPIIVAFSGQYTFIVADWVPWNDQTFVGWLCHVGFSAIPLSVASVAMVAYETISYAFYEMTIAHLKIMSEMFKRADFERRDSLFKVYLLHRDLFRIIKDIGELQCIPLQIDCLLYMLILCCGIFEVTLGWSPLTKRINLLETCSVVIGIFFWHCYKCETISSMCSEMTKKTYDNNWYEGTRCNKRIAAILNQRSQKEIIFGGVIYINLSTFVSMMKTSFSYYNALKAFELH